MGYIEPGKFENMTEDERNAVFDHCFEHNDHLRATGILTGEFALQPSETAVTLRWKNGRVASTDGPCTESKEQIGALSILEARDLNHAIQLVSELRGFKYGLGPIEIRLAADWNELVKASEQRRRAKIAR
ncbi:MAG: YciI family protein [Candidatus Acidiferrales bacterium]